MKATNRTRLCGGQRRRPGFVAPISGWSAPTPTRFRIAWHTIPIPASDVLLEMSDEAEMLVVGDKSG